MRSFKSSAFLPLLKWRRKEGGGMKSTEKLCNSTFLGPQLRAQLFQEHLGTENGFIHIHNDLNPGHATPLWVLVNIKM